MEDPGSYQRHCNSCLDGSQRRTNCETTDPPSKNSRSLCHNCPSMLLIASVALVLSGLPSTVGALTMLTKPQSQKARVGDGVSLVCRFETQPHYLQWQFQGPGAKLPTLMVTCSKNETGHVTCARELAFEDYREVKGVSGHELAIFPLRQRNDGMYTCSGMHFGRKVEESARVTVLVAPDRPTITADRGVYKEGQTVTLTCNSTGGNPKPSLTWFRRRRVTSITPVTLPPSPEPTQDKLFGATVSRLTFSATAEDDQAIMHCMASNEVRSINSSALILKVKYKPRIDRFTHNPYRFVEGDRVQVPCRARGNPAPNISWMLADPLGKWATSATELSFNNVRRSQGGIYTCTAKNSESSVSRNLTLEIHYPPSITLDRTYQVREYNNVELQCRVDAFPKATVSWKKNDPEGKTWDSSTLRMTRITRKEAGRYSCIATNTLRPSGRTMMNKRTENVTDIVVLYPPEKPKLEVSPGRTVIVSDPVTLSCLADKDNPGVPTPIFEWTNQRTGAVVSRKADYQIARVSLADNTEYRCVARNSQGSAPPVSVVLTVDERPRFLEPALPKNINVPISRSDALQLLCVARGKPAPQMVWLRDNLPIGDRSDWFTHVTRTTAEEVFSYRVVATLQMRGRGRSNNGLGLRPDDNAKYTCLAKNNKGSVKQSIVLKVEYKPRFDDTQTKVATAIGAKSARLVCVVSAVPPASHVSWTFRNDGRIVSGGRYRIEERQDPGQRLYVSELTITGITRTDLGPYQCGSSNDEGNGSVDIHLQEQSVPERPDPVRIISDTWESMEMEWRAPFNGGFQQTLDLELKWNRQHTLKHLAASIHRYNITGLKPRTNYTVSLRGRNELGSGAFSIPVRHLTKTIFIPRIETIKLDARTRTLTFSGSKGYCVRVEISRDGGRQWSQYRDCLNPESKSLRLTDNVAADSFRAFLCLQRRPDVCSEPMLAEIVENIPDIPTKTIIVVACVCALVILILLAVLLYFCCKRRQPRKSDFEANPPHRRPQAMAVQYPGGSPQHNASANSLTTGKPYAMVPPSGHRDSPPPPPGVDQMDGAAVSAKPVFATSQSSKDPLRTDNQSMDLQMTPLTADSRALSPTPNGDGWKPRKVIYEVVV